MSISIGGSYLDIMNAEDTKSSEKADKLEKQLTGIKADSSDEELLKACRSFESYLVEKMAAAMEKTIPKNEEDGDYEKHFKDMLFQEYAQKITDNNELGIAGKLYEAMRRNNSKL